MVARYIPVGRIAVNMAAGATGFNRARFLTLSILAGCSWALYSVGIGVLAGHWVEDNPILGVAVAVGIALVIGLIVEQIHRRLSARRVASSARTVHVVSCDGAHTSDAAESASEQAASASDLAAPSAGRESPEPSRL